MRRSSITMLLSTFALVACSSAGSSTEPGSAGGGGAASANGNAAQGDGGSAPMGTVTGGGGGGGGTGSQDAGMDAAPQVTPDGCVITASPADDACVLRDSLGVYASVSKGSDASGDGSMAQPFGSAAHAIAFAKAHQKRVFLCAESYAENVTLENGVSIFGGLDCSQPKWTVVDARAHFAAPASPAARADSITTTTVLEAVEIFAPDATVPSGSSIGMIANASPALLLRNVWLQAGNAMSGSLGVDIGENVNGASINGVSNGGAATCTVATCADPGQLSSTNYGGTSGCGGGGGGASGTRGVWQSTVCGMAALCAAGHAYYWKQVIAPTASVRPGGGPGVSGAPGNSAASGAFSAAGFQSGDGNRGTDGLPGIGGNGGEGGPPSDSPDSKPNQLWWGEGGAGGGAGGCGGIAGTPGTGGGASTALIAIGSPLLIKMSRLTASNGGDGMSGSFGVHATPGGSPGSCALDGNATCGTSGGRGGEPGVSGHGAGGPSIALAVHGAIPSVDPKSSLETGAAGRGIPSQDNGMGKVIPASGAGVSQAIYSF